MQLWGAKTQRMIFRMLCGVVGMGWGLAVWAAPLASLSPASERDAEDAADLADASADSPVQRALSAARIKTGADQAAAPEPRPEAAKTAANVRKPDPLTLGESFHGAAKDLALTIGAVDAKQYLSAELGLDKYGDTSVDADADADVPKMRHRRVNGDADTANDAPPRSEEQMKRDQERASFLTSALIRDVMPWVIGAVLLLGSVKGLRVVLAYSQQSSRKRKYRESRSGSTSRNARL